MVRKRACDSCHAKKVYCDRAEPRCEWCAYRGIHCSYDRPDQKKPREPLLQQQMEQRIARLEGLLGPNVPQSSSPEALSGLLHNLSSQPSGRGMFYGNLHFAGFDLGETQSLAGIPIFSNAGLQWIRDRTGALSLFENTYEKLHAHSQQHVWTEATAQSSPTLPPMHTVLSCVEIFRATPLRRVFPVINVGTFERTIYQAYEAYRDDNAALVLGARACVFAFLAVLSRIEPQKTPVSYSEAEVYARGAQISLVDILTETEFEGLHAALMLCIYHDFTGNLQSASIYHAMAVRGIYGLRSHLERGALAASDHHGHLRDLFWLCYFFDKHISLRTGQPTCISDVECDLSLDEYVGLTAVDNPAKSLYPSDLHLTVIKSKVLTMLYSPSALKKSDSELLRDVRELDDQLEEWRLTVPYAFRPHLSVPTHAHATEILQHDFGMLTIFIHLEYLFLISAIHQACGRCEAWSDETWGARAVSSSLLLSVQASRSTLIYLQVAAKHTHPAAFWLVIFYPIWATLTVFCNILHHPRSDTTLSDIEKLQSLPQLIKAMRTGPITPKDSQQLEMLDEFVAELAHLAHCAISQASQKANRRREIEIFDAMQE